MNQFSAFPSPITGPIPAAVSGGFGPHAGALSAQSGADDDGRLDIAGLLQVIRRRWREVVTTALVTLGLALGYIAMAEPRYTASTTIFIDPRQKRLVDSQLVTGLGYDIPMMETQLSIIGSDSVLDRVINSENLLNDPGLRAAPGLLAQIRQGLLGSSTPRVVSEETKRAALREALRKSMKIKRSARSYVVDIDVTQKSASLAARIAQAIAVSYLADQAGSKTEDTRVASELLDGRLDQLRARVRDAENRVQAFKSANNILSAEGGLVNEQQLRSLNDAAIAAKAATTEAETRLDAIRTALASGIQGAAFSDVVNSQLVQRLLDQKAAAQRREQRLAALLGPRHPDLVEARQEVASLDRSIQAEVRRIAESVENEARVARAREASVRRQLDASKREANATNDALIKLRELEREVETNRRLLEVFLNRSKETNEQQNLALPDARIISPAVEPLKPSWPKNTLILALALVGGVGLGLARALLNEHLERASRAAYDVEKTTGLRELGALPHLDRQGGFLRRLFSSGETSFADMMMVIAATDRDRPAEYTAAALGIVQRLQAGHTGRRARRFIIQSPRTGDGASSVALSLAMAAAIAGERVLLVDGDFEDPSLTATLGGRSAERAADYVTGIKRLETLVTEDRSTGLSFLPLAALNLGGLRFGELRRMRSYLTRVFNRYDLVFIDAGALLDRAQSVPLADLADQAVVVSAIGATTRDDMVEALRKLALPADRIAGSVITRSVRAA